MEENTGGSGVTGWRAGKRDKANDGRNDMKNHEHRSKGAGLKVALLLTAVYLVVEFVGGVLTGSLALQADAGHMLSDVASLGMALLAFRFARKPATPRNTYGFYRAEILAAFLNGIVLVAVSAGIVYEALKRFNNVPPVQSLPMLLIAFVGLVVNAASAWALSRDQGQSVNERGAFLHVLADALGSLGAIVAGILMLTLRWYIADPIISLVIAVLIAGGAWRLIKETSHILMEGAPANINLDDVRSAMSEAKGVEKVHDLHIWTLTSGVEALSAHVLLEPECSTPDRKAVLATLQETLHTRFNIEHTTIQIEEERGKEGHLHE
jgi:cobalt-zinc-cadmium efflux system protein